MVITKPTIVNVCQLVLRITRITARRGHSTAGGSQGQIEGVIVPKDLQFIQAGLGLVGGLDGKPQIPGRNGIEGIGIEPRIHRRQQVLGLNRPRQFPQDLHFLHGLLQRVFSLRQLEPYFRIGPLQQGALAMLDSGKHGLQSVIVFLQDRIEFVVVATGAAHCQTQKGGAGRIHEIRQFVLSLHQRQIDIRTLDDVVGAADQETGRFIDSPAIACQLFDQKIPVGLVLVQGLNHVIAIIPGVAAVPIDFVSGGLTKPHHVQPVPGPAFSIVVTLQYLIDQVGPCFRRLLGQKGLDLPFRGQQSMHVQVQSANPCDRVGWWRRLQTLLPQLVPHKSINSVYGSACFQIPESVLGNRGIRQWLKGPMLSLDSLVRITGQFVGPIRALVNPAA